jgi:hypothetical protein
MQAVFSFSAQLCADVTAELLPLPLVMCVGDLEQDSRVEQCFYLRAHRVGNRNITVKVGQLDLALLICRLWCLLSGLVMRELL